jgi:lysozyme family protein
LTDSFDSAFTALLGNEGTYSDSKDDPGGETMWGVTARVARAHGYAGPMRDMPRDVAKAIYQRLYWNPLRCDEYDPRVAFQIFDANVNGGRVIRWMQSAAGAPVDGRMGPATIAAVKATEPRGFIMRFTALRLQYLTVCNDWKAFSAGWAHRIASNLMKGAS